MKLTKEQISNGVWILVIVIILFTPIGFHLKVLTGKILAVSADVVEENKRQTLENYHWELIDGKGNTVNFEDHKGKVVLVNFWATWCPPCVAELPSLDSLYGDYKDKVVFVFVASDEQQKVNAFLSKKRYELPVYFENSSTPNLLISTSIPATFILDKSGEIVVREIGAAKWDAQSTKDLLDQLLSE